VDSRTAAQQLLSGIAKAGGIRSDGLPRDIFARWMYLRLSNNNALFRAIALMMRLTGVEKRFSVYYD
jgi:hypothetical protein